MITTCLRFFGSGAIADQNGRPVAVRSRKQLALLAYLSTEHQHAHSRETLMGLFWPDESTPAAQNNLRVTLSRVREVANKIAGGGSDLGEMLLADRTSVQFNPTWIDWADVNRFNRLLARTRTHTHGARSQCASCQAAAVEAVHFYQDEFLAGFGLEDCPAFGEWLFMQRERLHLLAVEACVDLAAFAEENGDLAAARIFAQRQIEIDPLREPAYRQQMRILARQGERSLALAAFERCRTLLRDELGLDPDAETLALHAKLLEGDAPSRPRSAGSASAPDASDLPINVHNKLPQQLTPFIGREEELAQLRWRLEQRDARLLSLVGPGGIGKTRLAVQAAAENIHRFAHGACFVPLAGVESPAALPAAIMDALGANFVAGTAAPEQQLVDLLVSQQLLLVVDNFEHLMDGVDLLLSLLQAAPGLTLLVTTREELNCQDEDVYTLHGLAVPAPDELANAGQYDAVRLFCDRAYRLNKEFKLTPGNASDVVQICRLVEGMPLAIELASTWLRDLDCAGLAAAIAQGQAILATRQRDVPARHRSMHAIFTHSWDLLAAEEQRLLSLLAVCPGAFSINSAAAMTGASLVDLTRLRYKSLLRTAGSGYYEFHPLLRHFARAMLDTGDAAAAEARMAEVYTQHVAGQAALLRGDTSPAALEPIGNELDNVHHAWQWAQAQGRYDLLLQSVDGLGAYYAATGRSAEAEARFAALYSALEEPTDLRDDEICMLLRLHLLDEICRCQVWQGSLVEAQRSAQRLVALAQAAGSQEFEARGLNLLGRALHEHGQTAAARAVYANAVMLARQVGVLRLVGDTLYNAGCLLFELGATETAECYMQETLRIQHTLGNRMMEQRILVHFVRMRFEEGDYQSGARYLAESVQLLQATHNRPAEARVVNALGFAEAMLGNFDAAAEHHAASRRISREIRQPVQESHALHNLCTVERKRGNLAQAEAYGQEALRLALDYDYPDAADMARLHLGYLYLATGDLDDAAEAFQLAHDSWLVRQRAPQAEEARVGLAEVALRRQDTVRAAALIEPLVPAMLDHRPKGADEPFAMYLTCHAVLMALDDPRADALVAAAYTHLQALAAKITDKQLRRSFWRAPAHRRLRELWEEAGTR